MYCIVVEWLHNYVITNLCREVVRHSSQKPFCLNINGFAKTQSKTKKEFKKK